MGEVVAKLKAVIPIEIWSELNQAVDNRNLLAHHFWYSRAHELFDADSIMMVIADLISYADSFDRIDNLVSNWFEPTRNQLGVSDESIRHCMQRLLEGQLVDMLPDRKSIKRTISKLNRQQQLIRVWHIPLVNDGSSLIFELADGSFWQLSDIGLGSTRYSAKGSDWVELSTTAPYLPSLIIPRPNIKGPWEYEFTLAHGAVLWVKPGRRESTFKWGVRQPCSTITSVTS